MNVLVLECLFKLVRLCVVLASIAYVHSARRVACRYGRKQKRRPRRGEMSGMDESNLVVCLCPVGDMPVWASRSTYLATWFTPDSCLQHVRARAQTDSL